MPLTVEVMNATAGKLFGSLKLVSIHQASAASAMEQDVWFFPRAPPNLVFLNNLGNQPLFR